MVLGTQKKLLAAALAALLVAGCGGAEERKAKYLERGKAFIAEENWDKARVEIKNVLQIDPKSAEAYYLLGRVEEKKQEWAKAYGAYSKAVELDPEMVDARSRLAQIHLLQAVAMKANNDRDGEAKALGQVQTEIDEILKRDAEHAGALTLRANMLMREGKADEAIAVAEKVVKNDPDYGPAAGLLASLYTQKGKTAEAEKLLLAASAAAEDPLPVRLQLAQHYARQKNTAAAEKIMREIIASRPDELQYRIQLAQLLLQTDQLEKAEAVMREAVAADPKDAQRYLMIADMYTSRKNPEAAVAYLRESIEQQPELSELRLGLARLYEQAKKPDEAKRVYETMVAHYGEEPPGLVARNRLAVMLGEAGDTETASKLIEEVLAVNPKDGDALVIKGRLAMQRSDFDTAVTSFRAALRDQPDSVFILHLLAEAQLRNGDAELAGDNLRRAVEVAPQNADARIKYARYLITRKELVRALEQIDAVLDKDADNADAIAAKSEVLAAKGDLAAVKEQLAKLKQAAPDNPEASLRLARVNMAEGDTAAALAEVDAVLQRDGANTQALILKTDILATTKDFAALEAAIKQLKEAAPKNPEGFFRMGRYLRSKNDIDGALKEYEQGYALAEGAGKTALLTEIVNTQLAAGQAEQAQARVEAVLSQEPEHPSAYDLLGVVHMARKDYKAAEAAFAKQLQRNPNSQMVYTQLASSRERQGDRAGAIAAFEQGLGVLKDDVSLMVGLAGAHERNGDIEAAVALYEKVLAKQADNAVAVNNLAALLADHRTDAESLARAKELAVKLEPVKQPAMRDTLGWVHYRTGDYAKAVEVLEGVAETAPTVPVFHYHLGMAYAQLGDKAKARASLSKALELGDFPGAEEARKTLDAL